MVEKIRGTRPRPRVGIVGNIPDKFDTIMNIFPTIWQANTFADLKTKVHFSELDLIIVASDLSFEEGVNDYLDSVHVICFSKNFRLPSPVEDSWIFTPEMADSEEFILPDLPLPFNRLREADFIDLSSIRGWKRISYTYASVSNEERERMDKELLSGCIVKEKLTSDPLAVFFIRSYNGLGIAFLPNPIFNQADWVELLCMHWAEFDPERFPNVGNWKKSPEWMMPEELAIVAEIEGMEEQQRKIIRKIDEHLAELTKRLAVVTLAVNQGRRKLITAQGNELVNEVAAVFEELGFRAQVMDYALDPTQAKREDLRLSIPEQPSWEAIVEVRGYGRSSGQTADLLRLTRFASMFQQEKGRLPNKRIYVVNGEIEEIHPSRRHEPLAAAKEDIIEFSNDAGIVIWTLDLYQCAKRLGDVSNITIQQSIINAHGRWKPPE